MKLYGHPWSINTRKVLAACAEKGFELELELVNVPRGAHLDAAFAAIHPFNKVPVLDHDGFVVFETAAILHYLDEVLDGPHLWPTSPRERARALQWERVQQSYFEPQVHPWVVHAIFARHLGFPPDPAVMQNGRDALARVLDVVAPQLAETPFLAGETFSIVDLTWVPYLDYLHAVGQDDAVRERPAVAAWFDRVTRRGSWRAVAHTGMQPYDEDANPDTFAARHSVVA